MTDSVWIDSLLIASYSLLARAVKKQILFVIANLYYD